MHTTVHSFLLLSILFLSPGCAGIGPRKTLADYRTDAGLRTDAPVVLVDIDDTIYNAETNTPFPGAPEALTDLAKDHLVIYLTARPACFKIPGFTQNRKDSQEFLTENGFPDGPLFTSSLWELMFRGQGGGKRKNFHRIQKFGIPLISLAVGDKPHDLDAYLTNKSVDVLHAIAVFQDTPEGLDADRLHFPVAVLQHVIKGEGPVWPRIVEAYRNNELDAAPAWSISPRKQDPFAKEFE